MNSKDKMINALLNLLTIKDFKDINVSELCLVAKVHRTTFYAYYDNVFELLEDAKKKSVLQLKEKYKGIDFSKVSFDENLLKIYLNFVKDNAPLFKAYLKNSIALDSENDFIKMLESQPIKKAKEKYGDDDISIYYLTRFFIEGIYSIIITWINRDFKESVEKIANIISSINVNDNVYFKKIVS